MIKKVVKKKRWLNVLLAALLITFLLEGAIFSLTPPHLTISRPEDALVLYPEMEYYVSGMTVSGSLFTPTNNDPQIGFLLRKQAISSVVVSFDAPVQNDITIQVYYASEGENLSEERHVDATAMQGSTECLLSLPTGEYTHIRVDINGQTALKEIYVTKTDALPTFPVKDVTFRADRLLVNWALISAVLIYSLYEREKPALRLLKTGKEELCRKGWYLFAAAMVLCVVLRLNNSSMRCYNMVIPNNIAAVKTFSIGRPRAIRSDEYLGGASFFHDRAVGHWSLFWSGADSWPKVAEKVITLLNPNNWGSLFLSTEYAYSWSFAYNQAIGFIAGYALFRIITGQRLFSAAASLILALSPGVQWWWGPSSYGPIVMMVVLFYEYFEQKKAWKKLLCAYFIVCFTPVIVNGIYPAWDIPLAYFSLLLLIGIYLEKRAIPITRRDIPVIMVTCLCMAFIVGIHFLANQDETSAQLATVYPGARFSVGGDLPNQYWLNDLLMPFMPWKAQAVPGINQSEISSFLHLFPIPFVIYVLKFKELRNRFSVHCTVLFCAFCMVYMVLGIGDHLAKLTLLSYSTSERLYTVWGFSASVLLLLECYYLAPAGIAPAGRGETRTPDQVHMERAAMAVKLVLLNGSVLLLLAWAILRHRDYVDYMGAAGFCYVGLGLFVLANLLFFGKKRQFMTLMLILTLFCGAIVNPINSGTAMMTDTPLAREVRAIDAEDSGRWVALDHWFLPKYIYAQGVDCVNYLNWPPRFDLFTPLDQNGEYIEVYNRYAHMTITLTDEPTAFILNNIDQIQIDLNVDDLRLWDVSYVVSGGSTLNGSESTGFELIYHDNLDDIGIYRVIYHDHAEE